MRPPSSRTSSWRALAGDGLFDEAERVDVLDFRARAERFAARRAQGQVDVAAHRPLGHVAVGDAEIGDQAVQRLEEGHRLPGAAEIRLRDDLQQRRAGAVQVDAAHAVEVLVQGLARVLLKVRARDADVPRRAVGQAEMKAPAADDGLGELADLVALGQVRVEVVLAIEDRAAPDVRIDGQAEQHRVLDGGAVQYRQHARHRQVDGAGLRVRRRAEGGGTAGEDLRARGQLQVHLEADHHLPGHAAFPPCRAVPAGASRCAAGSGARRRGGAPRRSGGRSAAGPRGGRRRTPRAG
jgi:hypothetical protein